MPVYPYDHLFAADRYVPERLQVGCTLAYSGRVHQPDQDVFGYFPPEVKPAVGTVLFNQQLHILHFHGFSPKNWPGAVYWRRQARECF
jgi:hypothetical protein